MSSCLLILCSTKFMYLTENNNCFKNNTINLNVDEILLKAETLHPFAVCMDIKCYNKHSSEKYKKLYNYKCLFFCHSRNNLKIEIRAFKPYKITNPDCSRKYSSDTGPSSSL